MKKARVMMVLAGVLIAVACQSDGGPTEVDTTARVRFFNAVWAAQDNMAFTVNNEFAAGSSLGYLQSTQTCSTFQPGNASFALGLANTSGTGLNSNALASLTNQTLAQGGEYTVLAGGHINHPSIAFINNTFTGKLGKDQAAIRFVNLAAGSAGPIDVFNGAPGSTTTLVQSNMGFREATPFSTVPSGANAYTIAYNGNSQPLITGADATLNLKAGSINTIVISRLNPPDGDYKLINLPSCS